MSSPTTESRQESRAERSEVLRAIVRRVAPIRWSTIQAIANLQAIPNKTGMLKLKTGLTDAACREAAGSCGHNIPRWRKLRRNIGLIECGAGMGEPGPAECGGKSFLEDAKRIDSQKTNRLHAILGAIADADDRYADSARNTVWR